MSLFDDYIFVMAVYSCYDKSLTKLCIRNAIPMTFSRRPSRPGGLAARTGDTASGRCEERSNDPCTGRKCWGVQVRISDYRAISRTRARFSPAPNRRGGVAPYSRSHRPEAVSLRENDMKLICMQALANQAGVTPTDTLHLPQTQVLGENVSYTY